MIAVVAPEPAPWLLPLVRELSQRAEVVIFAPWAFPPALARVTPSRWRAAAMRRSLPDDFAVKRLPAFAALEATLRLWAGRRTDRLLSSRFQLRAGMDHLAARWLPGSVTSVYAPGCAALRTFAVARARGAQAVLVEDLPSIRQLHADLDAAARALPSCQFLRRFRAQRTVIVRQEAERALASRLLVRGRFARRTRLHLGVPESRLAAVPEPAGPPLMADRKPAAGELRVLLAGAATARGGFVEAVAAIEALPRAVLFVRKGEGTEPAGLLRHPQVRVREAGAREDGFDAVIAPAWCEAYPEELQRAVAGGIPVVTTAQAAGWAEPSASVLEVAPGDVSALGSALRAVTEHRAGPLTRRASGSPAAPRHTGRA